MVFDANKPRRGAVRKVYNPGGGGIRNVPTPRQRPSSDDTAQAQAKWIGARFPNLGHLKMCAFCKKDHTPIMSHLTGLTGYTNKHFWLHHECWVSMTAEMLEATGA